MTKEYTPDKWEIIKITDEEGETYCKILAEWGGSFMYGSSWKMSSPIVAMSTLDKGKYKEYCFECLSGSNYITTDYMKMLGVTTAGILNKMSESDKVSIEVINVEDVVFWEGE